MPKEIDVTVIYEFSYKSLKEKHIKLAVAIKDIAAAME